MNVLRLVVIFHIVIRIVCLNEYEQALEKRVAKYNTLSEIDQRAFEIRLFTMILRSKINYGDQFLTAKNKTVKSSPLIKI